MEHIEFAYSLNGPEAGTRIETEAGIVARLQAPELAWLHLHAEHPDTAAWMEAHLGFVEAPTRAALTVEVTRPRAVALEDGLVVILRGMNLNPGQDPEDMISLRLFLNPARIITLSRRPLRSVAELRDAIAAGQGPRSAGAFLAALVERLGGRIDDEVIDLGDKVDDLEDAIIDAPGPDQRDNVLAYRRKVIDLRRYLGPQRDALAWLIASGHAMLAKPDRRRLVEAHDRLIRAVEELDALRDRLIVMKDEIEATVQEKLNRNLYLLSILSAIFLPLGFLTGLFGINLAGMPGADHGWAFWIFTGALAVVAVLQLLILRRLRWI